MSDLRVYFEKQGADRLCGVHCLNSLAQGPFFTQVDLNKLAAELDKEESALLAADPNKPKPPRSMTISSLASRPGSHNVDDTGNFSLGVLEKALGSRFGLEVQNAARKDIIQKINREGLDAHDGFVVNLKEHWFSARAFPNASYPGVREWFFLDSLKPGPIQVTENDLWGTLQGIMQSGGSVFVLTEGKLPETGKKPSSALRSNQFFLSREEIKQLHNNTPQSSSTAERKEITTDWSKMGSGNTLGSGSVESRQKILRIEKQETEKNIILKPEPSESVSVDKVATILVRTSLGTREVRRFALENDTLSDLGKWIECIGKIPSGSGFALIGRGCRVERNAETRRYIVNGKDGIFDNTSLGEAGLTSGQEAYNLQL